MHYKGSWSGYVIKMNAGKTCGEETNSHTSSALWIWNTEFPQLSPHISIVLPTYLNITTTTNTITTATAAATSTTAANPRKLSPSLMPMW